MAANGIKPPRALLGALEAAANHVLAMDPDIAPRLKKLSGKVLYTQLTGLGVGFYSLVNDRSIVFFEEFGGEADVCLTAPPLALARMAISKDGQLIGNRDIQLEGDMQVAQQFQYLLASLNLDWEEQLAKRVGDIAARQVGLVAERFGRWLNRSQTSADLTVRDYLQEEVKHTPTRIEVENFADDIDQLRMDIDRIEARIQRLQNRSSNDTDND